jgi:hypothetical protein
MSDLSERVQREFDKMRELYEIPYDMEFQIKTLIKLQEEYNAITPESNNTRTRETLLHMIQNLQASMKLTPKASTYRKERTMYIDTLRNEENEPIKFTIYEKNNLYILSNPNYSIK